MGTRNTVTTLRSTTLKRLDSALLVLDVLSNPVSFNILDYLNQKGFGSELDLLIHTEADLDELDHLLESLSIARIIERKNDLFSTKYELNAERLEDITFELLAFSLA